MVLHEQQQYCWLALMVHTGVICNLRVFLDLRSLMSLFLLLKHFLYSFLRLQAFLCETKDIAGQLKTLQEVFHITLGIPLTNERQCRLTKDFGSVP